jgi:hypothetical protein
VAYTSVEDLMITYPRLSDTRVNSATLYTYIQKAGNFIDASILDVVSVVPIVPTPPLIKDLTEDLAYVMFLRRHVKESGSDTGITEMWKEVTNRLENIRNGVISIVGSGGVDLSLANRTSDPWSNVSRFVPTFGVGDIENDEVDEERIYEEETS